MTEEETSVDQRKPEGDLSYLAGWLCGMYPLGFIGALDFYLREADRKAFQALLCAIMVLAVNILVVALPGQRSASAGLFILGAWLFLPPLTLYYLRTLDWPAPAPDKRGWLSMIIFLGIIGILAAIAIPAYQTRAIKEKVWAANDEAKQRVEQYLRAKKKLPTTNADVDIPVGTGNKYIESLSVGADGVITIRLSQFVKLSAGKTVILTPHLNAGALTWSCDGGSLPDKYRSSECRQPPPGQLN